MRFERIRFTLLSIGLIFFLSCTSLFAQTPQEFQKRREAVLEKLKPNSVMILRSRGSFGTFHTESQDGSFYYLTGIDEPDAYLVLLSRSSPLTSRIRTSEERSPQSERIILFVTPRDTRRADWDALPLGIEGAKKEFGFKDVRPSPEFQDYFDRLLMGNLGYLYMDFQRSRSISAPLTADEQILKRARDKGAEFKIISPGGILAPIGRSRSEAEITLLRKAVDITSEAQIAAMMTMKPEMYEYQLQAVIEYVYTLNGSQRIAFPCIIGSGRNSCILHWMANSRKMKSGDIAVVDIGAVYKLYGADITRTIPVNGKFSKRQQEVYEIVLAANTAAIDMVAPGVNFKDISDRAAEIIGEGLVNLGLIKDKKEYRKYYFHGLGHPIGLRVGRGGRLGKLEPGMVLTIEPGIYIREEGLGIRIEDDILVTETGHEVLSKRVPKTIAEIEKLMKKKGLDYSQYLLKE